MGITENGTQDSDSNLIEQSNASENLAQLNTETMVAGDNTEKNQLLVEEITKEMGAVHEAISEDVGADKEQPGLVNVRITSVYENIAALSGTVSINPGAEKLESPQIDGTPGDRRSSGKSGKRKAKSKSPVTSSWSLRSRSQEKPKVPEPDNAVKEVTVSVRSKSQEKSKPPKPDNTVKEVTISVRSKSQEKSKAPEPDNTVKEATVSGGKKKGGKKQQDKKKDTVNEFSKNKSHLKYLLHRINFEQSLIDAYSAEGWKGSSLEKIKPEKELQQAKCHILRYKMKIRELFQRIDLSLAAGKLPESLFDSLGEIDCEDIFCAKCGNKDLTLDNDIILCDGACERGFHQFCLEPPLLKEDIPPGDEGWLCPGCDCKVECIDVLEDFMGKKILITDSWEKIFPEATGMKLDGGSGSTSDDDNYDPDKHNTADNTPASLINDKYLGLPSDDSEDDDFDPSAPDHEPDEQVNEDGSSSDFSSDSEDLNALPEDDDNGNGSANSKEENSTVGKTKGQLMNDELSHLVDTSAEPVSGRRRVERLDYKKLHEEAYGNAPSDSSDEDFDDTSSRKKTKTNHAKTRTPTAKSNLDSKDENQKESKKIPRKARKNDAIGNGSPSGSSSKPGSVSLGTKKRSARKLIGEAKTQKLYESFNENQYPDKDVRENLAKELDLTTEQVRKWFANARWSFNHKPRME